MTKDVNKYYYVSVYTANKIGPKKWVAIARIFRKDNHGQQGGDIFGEGATENSARMRALENAERDALLEGEPAHWVEK